MGMRRAGCTAIAIKDVSGRLLLATGYLNSGMDPFVGCWELLDGHWAVRAVADQSKPSTLSWSRHYACVPSVT